MISPTYKDNEKIEQTWNIKLDMVISLHMKTFRKNQTEQSDEQFIKR
jgi:hypothetical protein